MTHNQKKRSKETYLKMTQMIEFAKKDVTQLLPYVQEGKVGTE